MKKCIVIGAGFGGLSAAALLAKQGHQVTILEKNESAGGRASVFEENGFRFDMGPSWYLIREVFQRYFAEFGKTENDYYDPVRLDPSYRIFFNKTESVDISASLEKNLQLFESLESGSAEKLKDYLKIAEYQFNVSMERFLYREYGSIFDFFDAKLAKEGSTLHIFDSIDKYTRRYFSTDKVRKILQYNIVFLGGTPKNTPALYALMAHIDFNQGVFYPMGGFGKIVEGLVSVAKEQGVAINYNQEVQKIVVENGVAKKVITKDQEYSADYVVVNADYAFAETKLLEKKYQTYPEKYWKKKTIAPSAFIIYLGVNKKLPKLNHHNLFLENDWIKHFDSIFEKPEWPDRPSYYVCCPSKTDSTVAPAGSENIFILVPVAPGLEDTEEIREKYYTKIMTHLENLLEEDLKSHIVFKKIFAHNDFTSRYNAYKGTALGLTHTLMQSAIFRPKHQSKKVRNLFYTGQYTHPGIGLPMTIISSTVVAKEIEKKI